MRKRNKRDKWRDPEARERSRRSECYGKEMYETFWQAWRVAQRVNKRNHLALRPYCCRWCSTWHIGPPHFKQRKHRDLGLDSLDD